jgi:hypothetical protein
MTFGTPAQATLIGDRIYGYAAQAVSGADWSAHLQSCSTGTTRQTSDLFTQPATVSVGGGLEFSGNALNTSGAPILKVELDVSATGFALTLTNT